MSVRAEALEIESMLVLMIIKVICRHLLLKWDIYSNQNQNSVWWLMRNVHYQGPKGQKAKTSKLQRSGKYTRKQKGRKQQSGWQSTNRAGDVEAKWVKTLLLSDQTSILFIQSQRFFFNHVTKVAPERWQYIQREPSVGAGLSAWALKAVTIPSHTLERIEVAE